MALSVVIGLTACGDSSDDVAQTTSLANGAADGLSEPLLLECGNERFEEPTVSQQRYDGKAGWKVTYLTPVKPGDEPDPDLASIVTIVERTSEGERGNIEGGEEATLAGQQVSLKRATGNATVHIVQWKTDEARYLALVGGRTLRSVREVVRCMP